MSKIQMKTPLVSMDGVWCRSCGACGRVDADLRGKAREGAPLAGGVSGGEQRD